MVILFGTGTVEYRHLATFACAATLSGMHAVILAVENNSGILKSRLQTPEISILDFQIQAYKASAESMDFNAPRKTRTLLLLTFDTRGGISPTKIPRVAFSFFRKLACCAQ